jgi:hypothetical protein
MKVIIIAVKKYFGTEAIAVNGGDITCSVPISLPTDRQQTTFPCLSYGSYSTVKIDKNTEISNPRFYAVHRFCFGRADFHLTKCGIM